MYKHNLSNTTCLTHEFFKSGEECESSAVLLTHEFFNRSHDDP